MNIDENDFKRIMSKIDKPAEKKHIINIDKYYYWNEKAHEFADLCIEFKDDKKKHIEYLHQSLLATLERNEHYRITKKDMVLLWISLKYHNTHHKDKLYIDNRGRKVKKNDRRAIRHDANRF